MRRKGLIFSAYTTNPRSQAEKVNGYWLTMHFSGQGRQRGTSWYEASSYYNPAVNAWPSTLFPALFLLYLTLTVTHMTVMTCSFHFLRETAHAYGSGVHLTTPATIYCHVQEYRILLNPISLNRCIQFETITFIAKKTTTTITETNKK